jgi:hypothetical protein
MIDDDEKLEERVDELKREKTKPKGFFRRIEYFQRIFPSVKV